MRSVSSPQPELELVVLKTFKPIVGCGGGGDGADSEFVRKKVISDTCEICRIQARANWKI